MHSSSHRDFDRVAISFHTAAALHHPNPITVLITCWLTGVVTLLWFDISKSSLLVIDPSLVAKTPTPHRRGPSVFLSRNVHNHIKLFLMVHWIYDFFRPKSWIGKLVLTACHSSVMRHVVSWG